MTHGLRLILNTDNLDAPLSANFRRAASPMFNELIANMNGVTEFLGIAPNTTGTSDLRAWLLSDASTMRDLAALLEVHVQELTIALDLIHEAPKGGTMGSEVPARTPASIKNEIAPVPDEGEDTRLGPCCGCQTIDGVRHVLTLNQKSPKPGHGWGCVQCGLAPDGAVAVLCDKCVERFKRDGLTAVSWACLGYPSAEGRVLRTILTGTHDHDMSKHPEARPGAIR